MNNKNLLHLVKNTGPTITWKGKKIPSGSKFPVRVDKIDQLPKEFQIITEAPLTSRDIIKQMRQT